MGAFVHEQPCQIFAIRQKQQFVDWTFQGGEVNHFRASNDFQRCMVAYERQGRQASAISSTRFSLVSLRALYMPRSVCGNASGQDKERIAMYCAVHSPMPGNVLSLLIVCSALNPGSRMTLLLATACASDLIVRAR